MDTEYNVLEVASPIARAVNVSLLIDLPCSRHIRFDVFSSHQVQQQAHLHVVSKSLYSQDNARSAVPYGVLDHRMVSVCAGGWRRGLASTKLSMSACCGVSCLHVYLYQWFSGRVSRDMSRDASLLCTRAPAPRMLCVRRVGRAWLTALVTMATSSLSCLCSTLATSGVSSASSRSFARYPPLVCLVKREVR